MSAEIREAAIICAAYDHLPEENTGGCTCGFVAWSGVHVAVMAWREAPKYAGHR